MIPAWNWFYLSVSIVVVHCWTSFSTSKKLQKYQPGKLLTATITYSCCSQLIITKVIFVTTFWWITANLIIFPSATESTESRECITDWCCRRLIIVVVPRPSTNLHKLEDILILELFYWCLLLHTTRNFDKWKNSSSTKTFQLTKTFLIKLKWLGENCSSGCLSRSQFMFLETILKLLENIFVVWKHK